MTEAVHRDEGIVNQVMSDKIMALFGARLAHEDHAARACHGDDPTRAFAMLQAW
jgi:class 3 adenylate cyclase